jgi:hypothetical protein
VLVNGRIALRDGKVTGEQGGRVLARDSHMPSRAMTAVARRLKVAGAVTSAGVRVAVDISQDAKAPRAKGSIRITNAASGEVLEAADLGVLQTTKDWASVTAMMRARPSGEAHSTTLTVEHADPFVDGRPRTFTIDVDGRPRISGVLQ